MRNKLSLIRSRSFGYPECERSADPHDQLCPVTLLGEHVSHVKELRSSITHHGKINEFNKYRVVEKVSVKMMSVEETDWSLLVSLEVEEVKNYWLEVEPEVPLERREPCRKYPWELWSCYPPEEKINSDKISNFYIDRTRVSFHLHMNHIHIFYYYVS